MYYGVTVTVRILLIIKDPQFLSVIKYKLKVTDRFFTLKKKHQTTLVPRCLS